MRAAGVGQVVDLVQFLGGQRDRRRIEPDVALAVRLHQRAGVAGVGFEMEGARGMGVEHRVVADLLVGRQADDGVGALVLERGQPFGARDDAHRVFACGCCG